MATDLTTIAGALKRVYDNYVETQQNLSHKAIDEIAKTFTKYNPGGEGYFGSINRDGNESIGAITESEQFRTIDNENYLQWKVSPKVLVAPIEFSGLSSKAADSDEESFVNVVVDALDMARERLLKDENRQFYGIGTGLLANLGGTVTSANTTFSVDTAQYLRANMVIDIYSGATKTVASVRISDVDKVNNIVVASFTTAVTLGTAHQIVKENIRTTAPADGKEMMGLRGIFDDGTDLSTFQNLTVSSTVNNVWKGRRIDTSSANLTSDLLQRLLDDIFTLGGEMADTLIMHPKQRRKYLDIVVPQKRYMDGDMDSGFKKLEFNGIELWLDVDCQDDRVFGLKKSFLRKFELESLTMGGYEDSDKFLRKTNFDAFQAYWRHYCNFGTSKRNAGGSLVNLAKPTGVA